MVWALPKNGRGKVAKSPLEAVAGVGEEENGPETTGLVW